MILRGIRLKNYRAFVREIAVPLRPLTLLFGYNSAGKSAVLRSLPLMAESIRATSGPLALNERDGRAARGSTFREVRTRWTPGDRLGFGLDWADGEASFDIEIADLSSTQRQVIETLTLREAGQAELRFDLDIADEQAEDITTYSLGEARGNIRFEGWCAAGVGGFGASNAADRLATMTSRLKRLAEATHWLGALRALPSRPVPLTGNARIGDDGVGTIEVLARESLLPSSDVLDEVSGWFKRATEHELLVRAQEVTGGRVFNVELRPLHAPASIRLADTGEGMTQVLPVITLGALAAKGRLGESPLLAFEQPVLHLHPRAHRFVADYLIDVAKHATLVIETHSENLLLSVQLAIAEGRIAAEDVIVHWVRGTDEGPSLIEPITFDAMARPSKWPLGVFAEDRELSRALIERRHELGSS